MSLQEGREEKVKVIVTIKIPFTTLSPKQPACCANFHCLWAGMYKEDLNRISTNLLVDVCKMVKGKQ